MFLSFIIPLYNCQPYIAGCLDAILASPLHDLEYEVIIVDDGSNDRSLEICSKYVDQYQNILLTIEANRGPATARNTGLSHAKGDYVWFVDADDRIEPGIVEKLRATVVEHPDADLVSFGSIYQYPDREEVSRLAGSETVCSGLEFLERRGGSYLWNNIYKRLAIGNKHFIDGVRHIEDSCFNVQVLIDSDKVVSLPDIGYYYNKKNANSISFDRRLRDRVKANDDSFIVYNTLYRDMLRTKDKLKRTFLWRYLNFSVAAHLYTMMRFDNFRTVRRYIDEYRLLGLYPLEPTGNRKSDLFIRVANHERLFLWVCKIGRIVKQWA